MILSFLQNKKEKSFTLIEMLVVVALFSLIITTVIGAFVAAVRNQKKVLTYQQLLDQTSYSLEYMSRALRMAKKDTTGTCLTTAGANYEFLSDNGIRFLNSKDKCQEFNLEDGSLKGRISSDNKRWSFSELLPLTSNDLQINSVTFFLQGENQTDNLQPKVTIFLEIQGKGLGSQPKLNIQTTISQRNLDTQLDILPPT